MVSSLDDEEQPIGAHLSIILQHVVDLVLVVVHQFLQVFHQVPQERRADLLQCSLETCDNRQDVFNDVLLLQGAYQLTIGLREFQLL